jgi:GntR family transcriptional regulator
MKSILDYKYFLNEDHPIPLYYQLELIIQNYIKVKDLQEGNVFFSEQELAEQLDVSRPTVNKAIKNLIKKGYLKRKRGRKSVVSRPKNVSLVFLDKLLSFGEMIKNQGYEYDYRTELIERRVAKPNNKITESLKLEKNEDVVFLKRLRYIEEEPIIIVDSYFSIKKYEKLLKLPPVEFERDLYSIIENHFGVKVYKSDREVTAGRMTLEDAAILNVDIWDPCLRLSAVAYDKDLVPIEYFDSIFKGEACSLKTSLVRNK